MGVLFEKSGSAVIEIAIQADAFFPGRCRSLVPDLGVSCYCEFPFGVTQSKAKIGVLPIHKELLVQKTHAAQCFSRYQHACSGNEIDGIVPYRLEPVPRPA